MRTSRIAGFSHVSVSGILFLGLIVCSVTDGETSAETTPLNGGFRSETTKSPSRPRFSVPASEKEKQMWKQGKATTPSDIARITRRQTGQDPDDEGPCGRFSKDVSTTRNEFEFYSPGSGPGSPYPNETDCIKTILAPPGHLLRLDFRDEFRLEQSEDCRFDYLEIRDGAHGYSNLVGKFCGNKHPPPITSSDRYLWLRFVSDENIQYSGFRAVYWFVPRPTNSDHHPEVDMCRIEIEGEDGWVNSTDVDENQTRVAVAYGLPLDCMWIITVREGWKIMLQFKQFKLKSPNDCDSNFVDVFSDRTDLPSRLKNFCGSIADSVTSKNNVLHVRFFAEARSINSTFDALFTAFRDKKKDESCAEEEYDCEDATCISKELECNGRANCRFKWDEDECTPQLGVLAQIDQDHIIVILVVFCLILSGMCFAFLFNCTRKLVRDHRIIQEHVRQSRENQLDGVGRKTRSTLQATLEKITTLSAHARSRSNSSSGGSLARDAAKNGIKRDPVSMDRSAVSSADRRFPEMGECYVPDGDRRAKVLPLPDDFPSGSRDPEDEDFSKLPETRDGECQTRESLFSPGFADDPVPDSEASPSPTPPPLPPVSRIPRPNEFVTELPPFSTFGHSRNRQNRSTEEKRYRAEAVIEMDDRKTQRDPSRSSGPYDVRPFSVDSTKSAPDVIVTH